MIKCSKCGKMFDEDLYNRICPKCGVYNKNYRDYQEEADRYFSGENKEKYFQDTGTDAKINADGDQMWKNSASVSPYREEDRKKQNKSREMGKIKWGTHNRNSTETFDRSDIKNYSENKADRYRKKEEGKVSPAIILVLFLAAVVLLAVLLLSDHSYMTEKSQEEKLNLDYMQQEFQAGEVIRTGDYTICAQTPFVAADETGVFPEGKMLVAVPCSVGSEIYDDQKDIRMVTLGYEVNGMQKYKQALSYSSLDEWIWEAMNLDPEDILFGSYVGNGVVDEGMFVFAVEQDAVNLTLGIDFYESGYMSDVLTERIDINLGEPEKQ